MSPDAWTKLAEKAKNSTIRESHPVRKCGSKMTETEVHGASRVCHGQGQDLRIIDLGAGRNALRIDSDHMESCIDHFVRNKLHGIVVSPLDGFKLSDLAFLTRLQPVEHLVVLHADMIDVSAINGLPLLRNLQMTGKPKQRINMVSLPALRELNVQWWPAIGLDGPLPQLRVLNLRGYRSKVEGVSGLPSLPDLQDLELVQSPILSLAGIDRFPGLKRLACHYLPKLRHIAPVGAAFRDKGLTNVEFGHCPQIADHDDVRAIRSMKVLWFNHCGKIPSLRFLDALPELEDFRFVGTEVLDGDLNPCLRLRSVGFLDKKTYSHRNLDFEARAGKGFVRT
jgi:protein phosphatase 1 regulatory subunit 7